jgi:dihydroneopterin aldolase
LGQYDELRLENWKVQAHIGAWEGEQDQKQELVLDVRLRGDFNLAADTDQLSDALDYDQLRSGCEQWLSERKWVLLETFTRDLCGFFLTQDAVALVKATVHKTAAQAPVKVSCTMTRRK